MPKLAAINRFRSEFRRWVAAHNEAQGFATNPDALLDLLQHRLGQESLTRIGSAYLNRWLQTEDDRGRGYFVREVDRPGPRSCAAATAFGSSLLWVPRSGPHSRAIGCSNSVCIEGVYGRCSARISTMTNTTMTPSRLWKLMTAEQRLRAASALWRDDQATSDQMRAALLIAKQMKFRPKTVAGLDDDRKAHYLASVSDLPEDLAARMLVLYHVAEQRPMMAAFLDAVGITHENGLIEDDVVAPDPAKIAAAAAAIAREYAAHDVSLYLNTLLWQDPAAWGRLDGAPEVRHANVIPGR